MSGKKLAAMQPYWLPHKGFFDLISKADIFIFMDSLENAKRNWLKSNFFIIHGKKRKISIPLKKYSSSAPISSLRIHNDYRPGATFRNFTDSYRKAPNWHKFSTILIDALGNPGESIASNSIKSIKSICDVERISPQFVLLSDLGERFNQMERSERMIGLCADLGANTYINNISGADLYDSSKFENAGVSLEFFDNRPIEEQPLSYLHHLMHEN